MASISIVFGGQEQRTVPLDKPRLVVGREPTCEIHIDNLGISRQHCAFSQRGEAFVVQDLGSSNGTYVNGKKITEHFLNNDDEVVIGKYTLKFKNETQAPAAAPGAPKADAGVPDTLNTYVMDGAKIQEQLAKMRAEREGGAKPGEVAPPPPGATAKDYAKALDAASTPAEGGKMKTYLIALAAVVVVLIIVVAVLMAFILKSKQGQ
ncbi:MAG TPA: FHA domain-containing protein [Planctomycetota bacterium]|nr:FHA domain-containing protein [Planctomycetota bacterium]